MSLWSQDQRFIGTRILMIPIGSVMAIRTHLQRESPNLRWETGTLLPLNCFLFVCEHDFATENCIFGRPSGPALAGPITTLPEERDLFFYPSTSRRSAEAGVLRRILSALAGCGRVCCCHDGFSCSAILFSRLVPTVHDMCCQCCSETFLLGRSSAPSPQSEKGGHHHSVLTSATTHMPRSLSVVCSAPNLGVEVRRRDLCAVLEPLSPANACLFAMINPASSRAADSNAASPVAQRATYDYANTTQGCMS